MEYEYAIEKKIPVAAFLLHRDSRNSWPRDKIEFEKIDKVNDFRNLCEQKMCRHWRNADDLGAKVVTALIELFDLKPRIGWIRGDSATSDDVAAEIIRLSADKRRLEGEIEEIRNSRESARPTNLDLCEKKFQNYKVIAHNETNSSQLESLDIINRYLRKTGSIDIDYLRTNIKQYARRKFGNDYNIDDYVFDELIDELMFYGLITLKSYSGDDVTNKYNASNIMPTELCKMLIISSENKNIE